jgi:hypothetical protein
MSYASPQHWHDIDSAGNALSWDSRAGKLLYPAYEMLRLALLERAHAVSISRVLAASLKAPVPAILQNPVDYNVPQGGWFAAFQQLVTRIIPLYFNHTHAGGAWDGLTTFAPNWTEATILADIGDAARIPAPTIPLAAWSKQQYEILNRLRWYRLPRAEEFTGMGDYDRPQTAERYVRALPYFDDITWPELKSIWESGRWDGPGNSYYKTSVMHENIQFLYSPGDEYRIYREFYRAKITNLSMCVRDFAVFLKFSNTPPGGGIPGYREPFERTYENNDYHMAPGAWRYSASESQTAQLAEPNTLYYFDIGRFDTVTASFPTYTPSGFGYQAEIEIVVKHDVPGGFKFITN